MKFIYISSLAYADDMTITSSVRKNTRRQLNKLSAYCKWMGFRVNALKCEMHIGKWTEPNPFNRKQLQAVRREASGEAEADDGRNIGPGIHINGPYGPPTIPYVEHNLPVKYLGAWITPSSTFIPQRHDLQFQMAKRLKLIAKSPVNRSQKMDMRERTAILLCYATLN